MPPKNFDVAVFPDFNGKYRVTGRGLAACDFLGHVPARRRHRDHPAITVAVAPKTPTGFKASESDGKVTVEWDANNTEGDLLGFLVERLTPGNTVYGCIAAVPVDPDRPASYKTIDDIKDQPSGDYRYRVKAVRAVNTDSQMSTCGDPGGPLYSPATTSSKITWKNPTPTSTTSTTAPGGGRRYWRPGGTGGTGGTGGRPPRHRPKSSTGRYHRQWRELRTAERPRWAASVAPTTWPARRRWPVGPSPIPDSTSCSRSSQAKTGCRKAARSRRRHR